MGVSAARGTSTSLDTTVTGTSRFQKTAGPSGKIQPVLRLLDVQRIQAQEIAEAQVQVSVQQRKRCRRLRACLLTGRNAKNPVMSAENGLQIYKLKKPASFNELQDTYRSIIYPHYISGTPAVFAVEDPDKYFSAVLSIHDPRRSVAPLLPRKSCVTCRGCRGLTTSVRPGSRRRKGATRLKSG